MISLHQFYLGQLSAVVAFCLQSTVADVIGESFASEVFPPNVLNLDVDPCDNLYEFACAGWLNKTEVPEDKNAIAYSFGTVQDAAENVLRELFESDVVGDLFKSCVDTNTLTALGYDPIEEDLMRIEEAKSPSIR
ncbi:TPA: hypothetical protein N0F65_001010 [Lagenidium giganteum]|uniref:Peptidase M13 N-terminal domain-containing protein n=1 Tax=Lagenidium giganteum TaxID=4803 RepID=A0AAV2YYD5_9STRA|nr:TPA: hypothetical protein N0F65_001010 [Lagenidium giganteum]